MRKAEQLAAIKAARVRIALMQIQIAIYEAQLAGGGGISSGSRANATPGRREHSAGGSRRTRPASKFPRWND